MAQGGGGEKTEQPTEKRKRDARKKGQVTKSQDLSSALLLLTSIFALWAGGESAARRLSAAMRDGISAAGSFHAEFNQATALGALASGFTAFVWALAPLFAALVGIAILSTFLQIGPILAFETIKPKLERLNPAESFKNRFLKGRPYIELGKTLLKIIIVAVILASVFWAARVDLVRLPRQSLAQTAALTSSLLFEIGAKVALMFLLIGVGDYFLQRYLYLKEMMMTKQEVKQEYKESEGDPLYKALRRQMHQEILARQMSAAVRRADVVVVNPTHVAVALEYDRAAMGAPVVVAKGAELMAAQIREIAREAGVPIMRDVPLARALYELELDEEIPEEMFEAVAVVLRWVYQLHEEQKGVA
ncbi:MAG TPA: type III secretion system export apparatus subunit SctU [Pyrinomonadaceae bacterium]|jgi:flagellar biosynthetic protein FlhB|nr:type III secretion system export apparatus subunit SctU [Pyrinomonadaceae bacterium]